MVTAALSQRISQPLGPLKIEDKKKKKTQKFEEIFKMMVKIMFRSEEKWFSKQKMVWRKIKCKRERESLWIVTMEEEKSEKNNKTVQMNVRSLMLTMGLCFEEQWTKITKHAEQSGYCKATMAMSWSICKFSLWTCNQWSRGWIAHCRWTHEAGIAWDERPLLLFITVCCATFCLAELF